MARRTTVVADEQDLAVLAHEARLRGISLGHMLGQAVANEAEQLRQSRRPRLGTFRAQVSIAAVAERDQPAAREFRS